MTSLPPISEDHRLTTMMICESKKVKVSTVYRILMARAAKLTSAADFDDHKLTTMRTPEDRKVKVSTVYLNDFTRSYPTPTG